MERCIRCVQKLAPTRALDRKAVLGVFDFVAHAFELLLGTRECALLAALDEVALFEGVEEQIRERRAIKDVEAYVVNCTKGFVQPGRCVATALIAEHASTKCPGERGVVAGARPTLLGTHRVSEPRIAE